jgi:hypothetical protein
LLGLVTALRSHGALAVYTFQSGYGSTDDDLNSTASVITDAGLKISSADPNFNDSDTTAVRFTAKQTTPSPRRDYFSFTVTASSGYLLNLSSLSFQYASSSGFGANNLHWAVRSSLDSYSTDIASGATTANATWYTNPTIDLGTSYDNLSSITFRIYVWDDRARGKNEFGYLDNIILDGVSVVPEPATVALAIFGLGAAGLGAGRQLYARKKARNPSIGV